MDALTQTVVSFMVKAWSLTSPIVGVAPEETASAIAKACSEKPLILKDFASEKSAATPWEKCVGAIVGVSRFESGFRQVRGDCRGMKPGDPKCNSSTQATSYCFGQIHLPDDPEKGEKLMADPLLCARAVRDAIADSAELSKAKGLENPLIRYAGGLVGANTRWNLAKQLLDWRSTGH